MDRVLLDFMFTSLNLWNICSKYKMRWDTRSRIVCVDASVCTCSSSQVSQLLPQLHLLSLLPTQKHRMYSGSSHTPAKQWCTRVSFRSNWGITCLFSSSTEAKWFNKNSESAYSPHSPRTCTQLWVSLWHTGSLSFGSRKMCTQEAGGVEGHLQYAEVISSATHCVLWTSKLWEAVLEHDNYVCPY